MDSASERSEPPSPKRVKLEEEEPWRKRSYEPTDEDLRLFNEEWRKSKGFDLDFTKIRYTFDTRAVDLDESDLSFKPDNMTNRDLLNTFCEMAISYYKDKKGTSLEFVKVLKANCHPSTGYTYYITFEAIDPSADGDQAKLFRAVVRHMPGDNEVCSCKPKPSC